MSEFMVTIEEIEDIRNHSNADRLQIGKLKGMDFQFILPKDQYEIGEYVVYFPVDSILSEDLINTLELNGKLAGRDKNRVKSIKLRGEISQGIVANFDKIYNWSVAKSVAYDSWPLPDAWEWTPETDITQFTGVTKYEVDDTYIPNGRSSGRVPWLKPLPSHVSKYDLESCQRFPDIVKEHLYNENVYISEKLEGSNYSLTVNRNGEWVVSQRNYSIDSTQIDNHLWLKETARLGLVEKVMEYFSDENATVDPEDQTTWITLRGEIVGEGIQGNIYNIKGNDIYFFDVEFDSKPIDYNNFHNFCRRYGFKRVPEIFVGRLDYFIDNGDLVEKSNGQSLINPDVLREGIVIRPINEKYIDKFGRLIMKIRSPEYLAKSEL